jgi:hypothetical protein
MKHSTMFSVTGYINDKGNTVKYSTQHLITHLNELKDGEVYLVKDNPPDHYGCKICFPSGKCIDNSKTG